MRSQAGFAGQKRLYEQLHGLVYLDQRPGESVSEITTSLQEAA
jgi:hypothetical protein